MTALTYKQKIILVTLFTVLFLVSSFYWYQSSIEQLPLLEQPAVGDSLVEKTNQQLDTNSMQVENHQSPIIYVHVKGAVKNAGVYQLEEGSRVIHAVEAAGGVNSMAELNLINLAAILHDGQEVVVFTSEEDREKWSNIVTAADNSSSGTQTNNLININIADSQTLQNLPGIGPAKAQAIISHRENNGAFSAPKDILKVSGIGDATFANLEALITVR